MALSPFWQFYGNQKVLGNWAIKPHTPNSAALPVDILKWVLLSKGHNLGRSSREQGLARKDGLGGGSEEERLNFAGLLQASFCCTRNGKANKPQTLLSKGRKEGLCQAGREERKERNPVKRKKEHYLYHDTVTEPY